jgi:hypothetical protein
MISDCRLLIFDFKTKLQIENLKSQIQRGGQYGMGDEKPFGTVS